MSCGATNRKNLYGRRRDPLDFPALAQRIVNPRTDTPEAAWAAAANSGYAGAIMAASHMMLGGLLLFSPVPVAPGLIQLGIGFRVYPLTASPRLSPVTVCQHRHCRF